MDSKEKSDLIKDEYFHLQKIIEDFDSKAITIKGWSVTFSLALITAAFSDKITVAHNSGLIFFIAAMSSVLFWAIDVLWKVFQHCYSQRITDIENWFEDPTQSIEPLQISHSWSRHWNLWNQPPYKEFRRIALWPHVFMPHAVIPLLSLLSFLLYKAY